jgi:nucleoside-diphosphate-sugar epimerase
MRRKPVVLVTGANGEMGHGLIERLSDKGGADILALDIKELDSSLRPRCSHAIVGDILDQNLLGRLVSEFEITTIFHLAALLSTRAEFTPETAHHVNVDGCLNLLKLAVEQSRWHGQRVKFLFPSTVAVYGIPDLETKKKHPRVREDQFTQPITMYGCNKLYCENLGRYFAKHYRQLAVETEKAGVDFRSIRFPGLISAFTLPSGGTSDYAPEMIHAAAQRQPYACFVREEVRMPFMAMPDGIDAIMRLTEAPADALRHLVYNVTSFGPSAGEIAAMVRRHFPAATTTFEPDLKRQAIVDSWPGDVDDSAARADWGWAPKHDFEQAFAAYLVPNIRKRYE